MELVKALVLFTGGSLLCAVCALARLAYDKYRKKKTAKSVMIADLDLKTKLEIVSLKALAAVASSNSNKKTVKQAVARKNDGTSEAEVKAMQKRARKAAKRINQSRS